MLPLCPILPRLSTIFLHAPRTSVRLRFVEACAFVTSLRVAKPLRDSQ
jgi:hypothetical protein